MALQLQKILQIEFIFGMLTQTMILSLSLNFIKHCYHYGMIKQYKLTL